MKSLKFSLVLGIVILFTNGVEATTFYVNAVNPVPVAPYTNWLTAATNIQDAIDATTNGDTVLVTNGIYAFGGKIMAGDLVNRVALSNAITVQSVNGPWVTTIMGVGATNGTAAVRCAWLTNGASLSGFTLMSGATRTTGDMVGLMSGGGVWCTSTNAFVGNCVIASNTATDYGGAVYQGTVRNSLIRTNTTLFTGGGGITYKSVLINCTIVSNNAYGATSPLAMTNCIIYFNGLGGSQNYQNISGNAFSHCCTTPALSGTGNFTTAPQLSVDGIHLATNSPCIGAGVNIAMGTDIFGNAWSNPPAVGCAEWTPMPVVTAPQIKLTGDPVGFMFGNFAVGTPSACSFAWLKDGVLLQDNGHFSFTQTTNLVATGVGLADAGNYQVIVSNAFGVVTSSVATLMVHCVDATGINPIAPYSTWATAATNIQDAITAAVAGDVVFVTNGLYASGGKSMDGAITNRVSLDKPILVQSVNGANATIIQGAWDPTSTNGPGAIRCAWMTNNAILNGFTLCGGATRASPPGNLTLNGGGVWASVSNGVISATVANCVIVNNTAANMGGGAYRVILNYCLIATNAAFAGGTTGSGAGAESCNLKNCSVIFNVAGDNGGGADNCNLKNCALAQNSAYLNGGAANGGSLVNCTVTANTASGYSPGYGAAVYGATLTNCIVFGNFSRTTYPNTNYASCTLAYSCADPLPTGTGNLDVNPQLLADNFHLAATSPCIGGGNTNIVSGTDIDGQPWNNPPSIGCDEWWPAPVIGAQPSFQIGSPAHGLTCSVIVAGQTPFTYSWSKNGLPIQDDGHHSNSGTANLIVNQFGPDDGGAYQVVVTNSSGAVTSTVAQVVIHAVNIAGANPTAPFSSWANAATNIQDAINAAAPGDIVLVTNGIYSTGGMVMAGNLTNRVALNKAITVTSVSGYQSTIIQGAWDPISTNGPAAVRCAWLTNGAVLNGFTLQNGATLATGDNGFLGGPLECGGGVWCSSTKALVSNCLLTNNSGYYGGGAAHGTLANSLIVGNVANYDGGGALYSTLQNCTVVNNLALLGGAGTCNALVENSIVVQNYDLPYLLTTDNFSGAGQFNYYSSCTSPMPVGGTGNTNADPKFLDLFHLSTISPCFGAGSAAYASGFDLDGEAWNTPPSMGCSEIVQSNLVGPLSVTIYPAWTNVLVNRSWAYLATITGRASRVNWSFGDGPIYTNFAANSSHQWTNGGDYTVTATAFNNDYPAGVSGTLLVHIQPLAAAQLQWPTLLTNGFQFQFAGQTNANYTIQYATNLVPPVTWQTLQTIYFNRQSSIQIFDASWTNVARFYRVLAQ
jgi:hypothetical protein